MGNEAGSVLNREPLEAPCNISWQILKCDDFQGREGHTSTSVNKKVL